MPTSPRLGSWNGSPFNNKTVGRIVLRLFLLVRIIFAVLLRARADRANLT